MNHTVLLIITLQLSRPNGFDSAKVQFSVSLFMFWEKCYAIENFLFETPSHKSTSIVTVSLHSIQKMPIQNDAYCNYTHHFHFAVHYCKYLCPHFFYLFFLLLSIMHPRRQYYKTNFVFCFCKNSNLKCQHDRQHV